MRQIIFAFALIMVMGLQPYSPCYTPPPQLYVYYYNNGKFIKKENCGTSTTLCGGGISNSIYTGGDNKRIKTDSVVFKIK